MFAIIVVLAVLISIGASLALAEQLRRLDRRLNRTELALDNPPTVSALPEPEPSRPLEGLRIAISVTQDHTHPVFANLLKEQLLSEDATEITMLSREEANGLRANWKSQDHAPDLLIAGSLVCNGYSEIYYDADFTCFSPNQPICSLVQKPPHGDRPTNLAIELIAKLKTELEKLISRNERRRAIRELHDPS